MDVLASEYGWAKHEILEQTYLDEAWEYMKLIRRRKVSDMQMWIRVQHSDPQEFDKALSESLDTPAIAEERVDRVAFENFKAVMKKSGKFEVKG